MWILTTPALMIAGAAVAAALAWVWVRAMFTDDRKARRDRALADRRRWSWAGVWGLVAVIPAAQVALLGWTTWNGGGMTTSAWLQVAGLVLGTAIVLLLLRWSASTDREPPRVLDYRSQREQRIFWDSTIRVEARKKWSGDDWGKGCE